MDLTRITIEVAKVCPISGIEQQGNTLVPMYLAAATTAQRAAAEQVIAGFDWSDAAQEAWTRQQLRELLATMATTSNEPWAVAVRTLGVLLAEEVAAIKRTLGIPLGIPDLTQAQRLVMFGQAIRDGLGEV